MPGVQCLSESTTSSVWAARIHTWLDRVLGAGTLSLATTVNVKRGVISRSRTAPARVGGERQSRI